MPRHAHLGLCIARAGVPASLVSASLTRGVDPEERPFACTPAGLEQCRLFFARMGVFCTRTSMPSLRASDFSLLFIFERASLSNVFFSPAIRSVHAYSYGYEYEYVVRVVPVWSKK